MHVQAALLALEVVHRALGVLCDTTKVVEAWQEAEQCLAPRPGVPPVPPDTPKLLPVVHLAWQHAMAVLQVGWISKNNSFIHSLSVSCAKPLGGFSFFLTTSSINPQVPGLAVVEACVALLPTLAVLAGGKFLSRRMTTEGWPTLERLLRSGAAQRLELTDGGAGPTEAAPGAQRRVRVAVLRCLAEVANASASRVALRGCVLAAGRAGLVLLGERGVENEAAEVRVSFNVGTKRWQLAQMLRALARVDPDAVWWLLTDADSEPHSLSATILRDVDAIAVPWHKEIG